MARRSKMTFEKKRREMDKKKKRAEKLERKHDPEATATPSEGVIDDPWADQGLDDGDSDAMDEEDA
ncbi:MAG: hypothetical protein KDB53_06310 [Planctomycetes bacterium]|nr:hypothetical protein [Planctomycetota bacterium]